MGENSHFVFNIGSWVGHIRSYGFWLNLNTSGLAYISASIVTKITRKLPDNCLESEANFDSLLAVHKDYEKWYSLDSMSVK